jgi:hypothetical protein
LGMLTLAPSLHHSIHLEGSNIITPGSGSLGAVPLLGILQTGKLSLHDDSKDDVANASRPKYEVEETFTLEPPKVCELRALNCIPE